MGRKKDVPEPAPAIDHAARIAAADAAGAVRALVLAIAAQTVEERDRALARADLLARAALWRVAG